MRRIGGTAAETITALAVALLSAAPAAGAVSINIGSASGAPGMSVTFQGSLTTDGAQVGGVQHAIAFDPATPIASCTLNPALASLSRWSLQPPGCTASVDCTQVNFVMVSFGSAIPDGTLYHCDVKIAANAAGGRYPLACSAARASDPQGQVLPVECAGGQVEVVPPTPTLPPTPPLTPTPASADGGGGCQADWVNGGPPGWCWLAVGIMLVLRRHVRWRSPTTKE